MDVKIKNEKILETKIFACFVVPKKNDQLCSTIWTR